MGLAKNIYIGAMSILFLIVLNSPVFAMVDPSGDLYDDEIRVLGIHDPVLSVAESTLQLQTIVDAWNATSLSTSEPITVVIANQGDPILDTRIIGSGSLPSVQLPNVNSIVTLPTGTNGPSYRDTHFADVVIGFGLRSGNLCGRASARFVVPGVFSPDPTSGLDLNGRNDSFVAIASFDGVCGDTYVGDTIAAHEFGHLLGALHRNDPGAAIADDVSAHIELTQTQNGGPGGGFTYDVDASVVVSRTDLVNLCAQISGVGDPISLGRCVRKVQYSDDTFGGLVDHNNANALDTAAKSVANYVMGAPPPIPQCSDMIDNDGDGDVDTADVDCVASVDPIEVGPPPPLPPTCDATSNQPFGMNGSLNNLCTLHPEFGFVTLYDLSWGHSCPSAVSRYEVWISQPLGGNYYLLGTTPSPSLGMWIRESSGQVRVRSCDTTGFCSVLSTSSFIAVPGC